MAFLNISTEGTFSSLPDSSLNILHANPGVSTGWISSPSMRIEGEPLSPRLEASNSLTIETMTSESAASRSKASSMFFLRGSFEAQPGDK
jgi:hypothetical protein